MKQHHVADFRRAFTSAREEQVETAGLHAVRTQSKQTRRGFTTPSEERSTNLFVWRPSDGGAKPRRGFTLIETFVATSVLLISLVGPLSIAAQALRAAYYARDQVTAFYLAQEGIEYVRAIRDQNYLATPVNPWLSSIDSGSQICVSPAVCTVDFVNFTHQVCTGSCSPLLLNASQIFNTQTGTPTLYTRTVSLVPITPDEVEIRVTLSWISAGISRSFVLTEHIFDWL